MTTVWNDEYIVRLMDLPLSIKGIVALDESGFPNIYINSRLSLDEQRKAVKHELKHIARNDFYNNADIKSVEGM